MLQNVKSSYKTHQSTNISPKTHVKLSTENILKFNNTSRIKTSSLKNNTIYADLMVPHPQQQDYMAFPKPTKTICLCTPWFQHVVPLLTKLLYFSLKLFQITVARPHPLIRTAKASSIKLKISPSTQKKKH